MNQQIADAIRAGVKELTRRDAEPDDTVMNTALEAAAELCISVAWNLQVLVTNQKVKGAS